MEDMITLSGENRTVVAGNMTVWTTSVEWNATYSAYIVVRDIPFPYRYRVDLFNLNLHCCQQVNTGGLALQHSRKSRELNTVR